MRCPRCLRSRGYMSHWSRSSRSVTTADKTRSHCNWISDSARKSLSTLWNCTKTRAAAYLSMPSESAATTGGAACSSRTGRHSRCEWWMAVIAGAWGALAVLALASGGRSATMALPWSGADKDGDGASEVSAWPPWLPLPAPSVTCVVTAVDRFVRASPPDVSMMSVRVSSSLCCWLSTASGAWVAETGDEWTNSDRKKCRMFLARVNALLCRAFSKSRRA
mmetsp:Transcript_30254/g.87914  ORF Transcript_30254/g.87914 Transcript_30254/m.87914 type:complete len:221 (+) Transcript_30254:796-1458(+)